MKTQVHATIDMGSATIKLVVGSVKEGKVNIYKTALIRTSKNGFKNSEIINMTEIAKNIKTAISEMKEELNIDIDHVALSIPPKELKIFQTEGTVRINSENKIIDDKILYSALKSCETQINDVSKIVYKSVMTVFVDDVEVDKNKVVGSLGTDLKVVANIYTIPKTLFQKYKETLKLANISISTIAISPLAISNELVVDLNGISTIVDIGHHTTTVSIFHQGHLFDIKHIPIAGKHITHEISTLLKLEDYGQATTLKHKYSKLAVKNNTIIHFDDYGQTYTITNLNQIVTRKMKSILLEVKKFTDSLVSKDTKVDYIITGGSSAYFNMDKFADKILGQSTRVYFPSVIGANAPSMTASIGLLYLVHQKSKHKLMLGSELPSINTSNWFTAIPGFVSRKVNYLKTIFKKEEVG